MDYKVAGKEKKWEIADLLIPWIPVLALFFLTAGLPFFWDTLQLASRHAHFFYETRFTSLFLPNDMDSGHIPVFGMYLAMVWQIFGRSLAVSHLAMLPFVAGILLFTRRVVDHFFKSRYNGVIVLFLVADATILAQITLVSPDVWILCFFTMALWAFVRKKRILLGAASVGLALTSMRGMMIVAAFFFTGLILECFLPEKKCLGGNGIPRQPLISSGCFPFTCRQLSSAPCIWDCTSCAPAGSVITPTCRGMTILPG